MKKIKEFEKMYLTTIKKKRYISVKTINKSLTKYYHTKIFVLKSIEEKTMIEQEIKLRLDLIKAKEQLSSIIMLDILDRIAVECKERPEQKQFIIYLSRQYLKGDSFHQFLTAYKNDSLTSVVSRSNLIQLSNLRKFMIYLISLLIQGLGPQNILLTTENVIIIEDQASTEFKAKLFYNVSSFVGFQFACGRRQVAKIDRDSYYEICLFLDKDFFIADPANRINRKQIRIRTLAVLSLIFILGRQIVPVIFANNTIKTLNPKGSKKIEEEVTFTQAQEIHRLIRENLYRILNFESTLEKIQCCNIPLLFEFLYDVLIKEKDVGWETVENLMNQTALVKKRYREETRIPKPQKKRINSMADQNALQVKGPSGNNKRKHSLNSKSQQVLTFLTQFESNSQRSKDIKISNLAPKFQSSNKKMLKQIFEKLKKELKINDNDPTVGAIVQEFESLNKKNRQQTLLTFSLTFELRRLYNQCQRDNEEKQRKSEEITPQSDGVANGKMSIIEENNKFYQQLSKLVWQDLPHQVQLVFRQRGITFDQNSKYFLGVALNTNFIEYLPDEDWKDILQNLEYCRSTHHFFYQLLKLNFVERAKEIKIDENEFKLERNLFIEIAFKIFKKRVPESRKVNLHHNFTILNQMSHLPKKI